MDDSCAQLVRFNIQPCDGDGKLKPARPCAAWVQKQHARAATLQAAHASAEDNRSDVGSSGLRSSLFHVVKHEDAAAIECDQLSGRQMMHGPSSFYIAANGCDRRYGAQASRMSGPRHRLHGEYAPHPATP